MQRFIVPAEKLKLYLEIAAFGAAVLFLIGKLLAGQFNSGMKVRLSAERCTAMSDTDFVVVNVHLERTDFGRLEIKDVLLEVRNLSGLERTVQFVRDSTLLLEHAVENSRITKGSKSQGTVLPPGDAEQIAYFFKVDPGTPVLVDATLLGARRALWISAGRPQWRSSLVVLPGPPCSSVATERT